MFGGRYLNMELLQERRSAGGQMRSLGILLPEGAKKGCGQEVKKESQ